MARIANDPYQTRGASRPTRSTSGASLILLAFVAAALIVLSRMDHPTTRVVRARLTDAASPVAAWATRQLAPLQAAGAYLDNVAELHRQLAAERTTVARLRAAEWQAAEATRKLAEAERLAAVVAAQNYAIRSARVLTEANGPFARALVIDAGGEHGLRIGHPVVAVEGLVGRVVEVGARAARVLLLSDITSRVPVLIGANHTRAIAIGDNSDRLQIGYGDRDAIFKAGDVVQTSGVGGYFPAGLRIGRVIATAQGLAIAPTVEPASLNYVSVLIIDLPADALPAAVETAPRRRGAATGRAG